MPLSRTLDGALTLADMTVPILQEIADRWEPS